MNASEILREDGVIVPEAVSAYIGKPALDLAVLSGSPAPVLFVSKEEADAAILALAREVAKWKWAAEHFLYEEELDGHERIVEYEPWDVESLLARYAEEVGDGD